MGDFMMLMHDDTVMEPSPDMWPAYFAFLRDQQAFGGGSAIGSGRAFRKQADAGHMSGHLTGYIRITAGSLDKARALLAGNPVFECGGTVEIRELPRD